MGGRMMKEKRKQKKSVVYTVLIVIFTLVFVVSAVVLGFQMWEYSQAEAIRSDLQGLLSQKPTESEIEKAPEEAISRFAKLYSENNEFAGWVQIDDTPISYPVVKGPDNEKYLDTTFYGEKHKLGTVFADYRTVLTAEQQSDNTVLYGHSAANGSYFMSLLKYKKLAYMKAHPFIQFDTLYTENDWVIMGVFLIDAMDNSEDNFLYHNYIDFIDEGHYNEFIQQVEERNYYQFPVDVQYGDQFLTLSTCDYDFSNSRMVVLARKLRDGETRDSFEIEKITENPDKLMPEKWYQ